MTSFIGGPGEQGHYIAVDIWVMTKHEGKKYIYLHESGLMTYLNV